MLILTPPSGHAPVLPYTQAVSVVPSDLCISHDSFIHMTRYRDRVRFVSIAELRPLADRGASDDGQQRLSESVKQVFPDVHPLLYASADGTSCCRPPWSQHEY